MNWLRRRLADEGGMTLVELVIAMSLLGIVLGPVTGAFILSLLESRATADRITDSSGAQVVSAFLVSDIQSAQSVSPTSTCVPSSLGTQTVVRLGLTWPDPSAPTDATKSTAVAYLTRPDALGQLELHRTFCTGATEQTVLLASNVAATNGFVTTCDGVACAVGATPRAVTARLTLKSIDAQSGSSYAPLTFEIKGTRRVGL